MLEQANFRFMVLKSSATAAHARDADVPADWEDVVQARPLQRCKRLRIVRFLGFGTS